MEGRSDIFHAHKSVYSELRCNLMKLKSESNIFFLESGYLTAWLYFINQSNMRICRALFIQQRKVLNMIKNNEGHLHTHFDICIHTKAFTAQGNERKKLNPDMRSSMPATTWQHWQLPYTSLFTEDLKTAGASGNRKLLDYKQQVSPHSLPERQLPHSTKLQGQNRSTATQLAH